MTTVSTEAPRPLWREENDAVFRATIDAAAEQLDVLPLAVEKDYWVCQALRVIEEDHPGCVIFKGGTSLEKLRIIERFSEDLDLLVVESYSSRGAIERGLKAMCATAASAIPGCEPVRRESGGIPSAMHRSVHLALPSHPYTRRDGIADADSVLLELGQSGGREPSSVQPVTTLLGRRLESAGVAVGGFADCKRSSKTAAPVIGL